MKVPATCKFCHKPLTLTVDDSYAEMGDPFKLMKLACCNRCGDYYTARRQAVDKVHRTAMKLFGGAVKKEELPKYREILAGLVKHYMRLYSDYKDLPMPDWDEAIVDDMLSKPGNYGLILEQIPRMFSQPTLV
jgi:hypothetical protein